MSKVNKLFLILGVILFSIMLTSCYKEEKFTFKEGKYEYTGEEFNFYNDVKLINTKIRDKEINFLRLSRYNFPEKINEKLL